MKEMHWTRCHSVNREAEVTEENAPSREWYAEYEHSHGHQVKNLMRYRGQLTSTPASSKIFVGSRSPHRAATWRAVSPYEYQAAKPTTLYDSSVVTYIDPGDVDFDAGDSEEH